jgi:hypothetical protein
MKIIKGNIKFSDLPKEEKISEIEIDAIHWKEIFQDEEAWQNCSDSDYKKQAKTILIADENIDYKKYSLIELENGRRKWVRNEHLERVEEDEELGIY